MAPGRTRAAPKKCPEEEEEVEDIEDELPNNNDEDLEDDQPADSNPPTSINPYTVLSIATDADSPAITKAYRKAALQHHPDKAPPDQKASATQKFQEIAFAYAVLSDPRRRARYDATGSTAETLVPEDGEDGEDFDWASFYRDAFAEAVTEEKISKFADEYRRSDEERADLLKAYTTYKGDLDAVFESVMLSNVVDDEARFRETIDAAIANGEVESHAAYTAEPKAKRLARLKRAEKEAKEAAKEARSSAEKKGANKSSKKGEGMADLAALIQSRQAQRQANGADFLASLEERYAGDAGKGKKGKGKRARPDEPSEEAFARNRKRRA